ncbi:hypothetical protein HXA34_13435 [Salipaludibacillus agaradhaerens]|jgi:hypothetical protein|uniref:hypothetical protein n=1 Tax=Salipaludibacillus agaradhaerens TaxID=76935 RepID=UPI002151532C|nr:hypothetical protein [Salipaludibacillus agaradhaerens]MCR6107302.1 hypothetical protein [Salipaludibacillus agaradhaerens]MCR6111352.1 hypothetical protein [Bacillus sp. A301a_S52]MCR6119331.1 hypothetical protein [Salipaludibacillus agaradhaerens]
MSHQHTDQALVTKQVIYRHLREHLDMLKTHSKDTQSSQLTLDSYTLNLLMICLLDFIDHQGPGVTEASDLPVSNTIPDLENILRQEQSQLEEIIQLLKEK